MVVLLVIMIPLVLLVTMIVFTIAVLECFFPDTLDKP